MPNEIMSASVTSFGTLRMWITREGEQGERSPLNVLLSFPLAQIFLQGRVMYGASVSVYQKKIQLLQVVCPWQDFRRGGSTVQPWLRMTETTSCHVGL